jgi:hypothetical protein
MSTFKTTPRDTLRRALSCVAGLVLLLAIAAPALASETVGYSATYVEPVGGPAQSPFGCEPGTSCGSANVAQLGRGTSVLVFNGCGLWCHVRTITFVDGSTLVIEEYGPLTDFASRGNAGQNGYNGFGLAGNPQFLDITHTVVGGTGRFAGATGSASGTVTVAGGVATIKVSGTITLP